MSNGGLIDHWGLDQASPSGGDSKQAQEFRDDFKALAKDIASALTALTLNAAEAVLNELKDKLDQLYEGYQDALEDIEPGDETVAEEAIEVVLERAEALVKEIAALASEVEKALKAWRDLSTRIYEEIVGQIEALDEWGEAAAADLLAIISNIDDHAADRLWQEATDALKGLAETVKPHHEALIQQQEAKKKYDGERPQIGKDFEGALGFGAITGAIQGAMDQIGEGLASIDEKAELKDFVSANDALEAAKVEIQELLKTLAEAQKLKQEYDTRLKGLSTGLAFAAEAEQPELVDLAKPITQTHQEAEGLAAEHDYEKALAKLDDLKGQIATYDAEAKEVLSKEAYYQNRLIALLPRLADLTTPPPTSDGAYYESMLGDLRTTMEEAAAKGDYDTAMGELERLEAGLEGFETYVATFEADRTAYQTRYEGLTGRLAAVDSSDDDDMAARETTIGETRTNMEKLASTHDYGSALATMDELEVYLTDYEAMVADRAAEKAEVEQALAKLAPRMAKAEQPQTDHEDYDYSDMVRETQEEIESAIGDGDYEVAQIKLREMEEVLAIAEGMAARYEERTKAFEDGLAALIPRIAKVSAPLGTEEAEAMREDVGWSREEAEREFKDDNLDEAMKRLNELEAVVAAFEVYRERFEAQEAEYEKRLAAVDSQLAKLQAPPGNEDLEDIESGARGFREEIQTAADEHDYEKALGLMDEMESGLAGYDALMKQFDEAKATYKSDLAALQPRYSEAMKPGDGEWTDDFLEDLESEYEGMENLASENLFDEAIAKMSEVEQFIVGIEAAKKRFAEAEADGLKEAFEKGSKEIAPKLAKANDLPPTETGENFDEEIKMHREDMEKAADEEDYESAVFYLSMLEASLASAEVYMKRLEDQQSEYQTRYEKAATGLAAVDTDKTGLFDDRIEGIINTRDGMKEAAEDHDYDTALKGMDELEALLIDYEGMVKDHEDEKAEYEKRYQALTPRVQEALEPVDREFAEELITQIKEHRDKVEELAGDEEYEKAMTAMVELEEMLVAQEAIASEDEAIEAAYRELYKTLLPRLAKAAAVIPPERAELYREAITDERQEMEDEAKEDNFRDALQRAKTLKVALDAHEIFLTNYLKQEEEFKARALAVEKRLIKINPATENGNLADMRQAIKDMLAETRKDVAMDYDHGLSEMDKLEAAIDAFEVAANDQKEEKRDFDRRLKAIASTVDEIVAAEADNDDAKAFQAFVVENQDLMQQYAERKDFEDAMTYLSELEQCAAMKESKLGVG